MAKYVIDSSTLTAIADEIRTLIDEKGKITTSDIITAIHVTNREIDKQDSLLSQIILSLGGKVITNIDENIKTINSIIDRSIKEITSLVAKVGAYSFHSCTSLKKVTFPHATTIEERGFYNCTALTDVYIPEVKQIAYYAFYNCLGLTKLDLNYVSSIDSYAFYYCQNLDTLILRKEDALCTLAGGSALRYTKIDAGEGYIYVPAALYNKYRGATNWTTYSKQFRKIEDYPEICGG